MKIVSAKKILKGNDQLALTNQQVFESKEIYAVNLLGSPGGGKTTLLEALLPRLQETMPTAVIEGDLATSQDAERIEAVGVPAVQVNTEGACHLDACMVASAMEALELDTLKLVFIENVGNLVCTAGFKLGEHKRVVILSVAEGDDKVAKYPPMFQNADAVVLNKTDLLGKIEFDMTKVEADLQRFLPEGPVFKVSARTGEGLDELARWLTEQRTCRFAKE